MQNSAGQVYETESGTVNGLFPVGNEGGLYTSQGNSMNHGEFHSHQHHGLPVSHHLGMAPGQNYPYQASNMLGKKTQEQNESPLQTQNAHSQSPDVTLNHMLMNLDITPSNFTKVVNFGALSETSDPQGELSFTNDPRLETSLREQESEQSLLEQSLEPNSDLFEHQQAKEQARLLDRFKQLREWQMQQQTILMKQQQEQLEKLKSEQEKVKKMIAKQREQQWGGPPNRNGFPESLPPSYPSKPQGVISQSSGQHSQSMGMVQQRATRSEQPRNMQTEKTKLVTGRPLPDIASIPSTPEEYRLHGNPALDSDTATIETKSMEDGVYPFPETSSETSEPKDPPPPDPPVTRPFKDIDMNGYQPPVRTKLDFETQKDQEASPRNVNSNSLGGAGGYLPPRQHNGGLAATAGPNGGVPPGVNLAQLDLRQGVDLQTLQALMQQFSGLMSTHPQTMPLGGVNGYPMPGMGHPTHFQTVGPPVSDPRQNYVSNEERNDFGRQNDLNPVNNVKHFSPPSQRETIDGEPLDFRERDQFRQQESVIQVSKPITVDITQTDSDLVSPSNDNDQYHTDPNKMDTEWAQPAYEDENNFEDANDERENSEEEYTENPHNELENRPISGIAGKKKSFEELLEEELQKEAARLQGGHSPNSSPQTDSGKKHFLKKGEGISRFSGKRKPPPKKNSSAPGSRGSSQARSTGSSKDSNRNKPTSNTGSGSRLMGQSRAVPKIGTRANTLQKTGPKRLAEKILPVSRPNPRKNETVKLQLKPSPPRSTTIQSSQIGPPSSQVPGNFPPPGPKTLNGVAKSTDTLGEVSFANRMNELEQHEEVENDELEEFEILEKYADDNASFLSNVSAVNRVVQKEKNKKVSPPRLNPQKTENGNVSDTEDKSETESSDADDTVSDSSFDFDLDEDKDTDKEDSALDKTLKEDTPEDGHYHGRTGNNSGGKIPQRKVAFRMETRTNESFQGQKSGASQNHLQHVEHFSESDVDSYSEMEVETNDGGRKLRKGTLQNNVKDTETEDESQTESENEETEHNSSVVMDVQLHTKTESGEGDGPGKSKTHGQVVTQMQKQFPNGQLNFEDDESWDESSDDIIDTAAGGDAMNSPQVKNKMVKKSHIQKTKVDPSKEKLPQAPKIAVDEDEDTFKTHTPPPTSMLVSKLFPKLKEEKPKPLQREQQEKLEQAKETDVGEGVQSKALREKLLELEREIERFRSENATLGKLRKDREEGLEHLKKEMQEFEKQKDDELKRLQEFKAEEIKKLRKEKRVFEQYQKSIKTMPDKKEREEIQALKKQVSDLQEEMRKKESRWTANSTRLRDRIEHLEQENQELKEEIKVLEKLRLENWQQKSNGTSIAAKAGPKKEEPIAVLPKKPSSRLKSPKAASKTSIDRENLLRLSTNIDTGVIEDPTDLDTSVEQGEERPGFPQPWSPEKSTLSPPSTPRKMPAVPVPEEGANGNQKKTISRKRAVHFSITNVVDKGDEEYEEIQHPDGKVEKIYTNGAREILFSNGTRKQISLDGQSIIVSFFNGDIKQILPDQRVIYYYSDAQTTHTTYPDGLEIMQFPNSQIEKHYPDGTREITFPDQTIKYLFPSGIEESIFPDGTVIRVEKTGDKTMEFPNGQREIHTPQYKRREYPDGTVKTVYPDGKQETRYSSGRLRVKDKEGNIIVDKRV